MKISGFDELNTPKVQVEEPEEYFKKMDISPKQRKERVETSKELADVMLFLFALLAIEMQANKPNYPSVLRSFRQRFRDVVNKHSRTDEYVENYINEFIGGVFDTTRKYMEAAGVGMDGRTDAGWWTSVDRATVIGENEANSILNYEDLQRAADEGYTTKEWVTERDNRVRPTHKEVDGVTIGINEYFIVGGGMMLAPHDEYNNPDECPNCRCALRFGGKGRKFFTEREESTKIDKALDQSVRVSRELLDKDSLRNKIRRLFGEDIGTTREITNNAYDMLKHRDGTHFEDLAYVDTVSHKSEINKDYDFYDGKKSACKPNKPMNDLLAQADNFKIIGLHNHPGSHVPSVADLYFAQERKYKYGIVFGHNGTIYKYGFTKNIDFEDDKMYDDIQTQLDKLEGALINLRKGGLTNEKRLAQIARRDSALTNLSEKGVKIEVFE